MSSWNFSANLKYPVNHRSKIMKIIFRIIREIFKKKNSRFHTNRYSCHFPQKSKIWEFSEFTRLIFNTNYFSRMGLEMDWFRCTILRSCRSFCCCRRNFLLRFFRRHLLAQKAWTHARSDVFKRTHFTWRRSPLRFCLLDVPLFGPKTISRNRCILDTV